jgi:hypothetical protein
MMKLTPPFSVIVSVIAVDVIYVGRFLKASMQLSSEGAAHSHSHELQPPNLLIK